VQGNVERQVEKITSNGDANGHSNKSSYNNSGWLSPPVERGPSPAGNRAQPAGRRYNRYSIATERKVLWMLILHSIPDRFWAFILNILYNILYFILTPELFPNIEGRNY
jgi:hypothetical protein